MYVRLNVWSNIIPLLTTVYLIATYCSNVQTWLLFWLKYLTNITGEDKLHSSVIFPFTRFDYKMWGAILLIKHLSWRCGGDLKCRNVRIYFLSCPRQARIPKGIFSHLFLLSFSQFYFSFLLSQLLRPKPHSHADRITNQFKQRGFRQLNASQQECCGLCSTLSVATKLRI